MKPTPASKSPQYAFLVRDFLGRPNRTETQGQQNLLRYYASRNKQGQCNPGMKRIEQDTGLCQQTITDYNNYYKNLGILGWIRGCGTGGNEGGSGQSNLYQLNAQKLQELSGKTIPATTPVPVEAKVSATTPFGGATTPVGVPKYQAQKNQAQKNQANTNTNLSGESMANPTDNDPHHDSKGNGTGVAKIVNDTKPSANAPSANAMALARMITPDPSADQAMKLEVASTAFKLDEYRRAIGWAKSGSNEWWATKVGIGMVAKQYHKLMDDYNAANPDTDKRLVEELTSRKPLPIGWDIVTEKPERATKEIWYSKDGKTMLIGWVCGALPAYLPKVKKWGDDYYRNHVRQNCEYRPL